MNPLSNFFYLNKFRIRKIKQTKIKERIKEYPENCLIKNKVIKK